MPGPSSEVPGLSPGWPRPTLATGDTVHEHNFSRLVEGPYTSRNIPATVADRAKMQYSAFCRLTEITISFQNFVTTTNRLDEFYFKHLDNRVEFAELWCVIKLVLVLSPRNAAVESGFSVNGEMLV